MKSLLQLKIIIFLIIYLFFPVLSLAQNISSLEDCINIALKNNNQYRNSQNREKIAGSQVLATYSRFLPQVSFGFGGSQQHLGSLTRYYNTAVYKYDENGKPVTDESGRPIVERYVKTLNETEPQIRNNFDIGMSVSQLIFDGGQWWNNLRKQNSNKNARTFETEAMRLGIINTVKRSYYELLKAQNQLIVLEDAVELAEEQLRNSKTRFEVGFVAEIDVLRAQVNLNNQRIQLFTQQNEVEIARINLNTVIGLEPNNPLIILEDSTIDKTTISIEEALIRAERNNPYIKMAQEDIDKNIYSHRAAKGTLLPTISANLSYSRSNPDIQLIYRNFNRNYSWSYNFDFSLPIFNGFKTKSDIQLESLNLKIAEEDLINIKRTVLSNVQQYHIRLINNLDKIKMLQENLLVAEENVRLAQERYRVGSGTLLETIDAQVSYTQSRIDLIRAIYDAKIAQAQLEGELG